MDFLQNLVSFIIVIGVLVFVHELGHFLAALWTGMRADVFALGMGPRVLGWNKINGFTFGKLSEEVQSQLGVNTDYRLCALPIGGYVKILGMVDESMDNEFATKEPQPYEFRSKGALARAFVLSAGVIMNLLLAVVVFWWITVVFGTPDRVVSTVGVVDRGSLADEIGLQPGDQIRAVNGVAHAGWAKILRAINDVDDDQDCSLLVRRGKSDVTLRIPNAAITKAVEGDKDIGVHPDSTSVVIVDVVAGSPAEAGALKPGDSVIAINGHYVVERKQFVNMVKVNTGRLMRVQIGRKGRVMVLGVQVNQDGTIGVSLDEKSKGQIIRVKRQGWDALMQGIEEVTSSVKTFAVTIFKVITGVESPKQSLGGPIAIAKVAGKMSSIGLDAFLGFMAALSVSLAVLNLLPIPGLDGGHLVFVAIEAVLRREISTAVKIRVQQVGMTLLLALMAYIFYLDLTR